MRTGFESTPDSAKRYYLAVLLTLGFKPYKLGSLDPLPDTSPLFLEHIDDDPQKLRISIGYRADGRPWSAIQSKGGCQRRVDAQDQAGKFGLWEPWHPFSLNDFRESLWFRRGRSNLDNCLTSVVSVGVKFSEIIQFPKLNDGQNYPTLNAPDIKAKHFDQWPGSFALPNGVTLVNHPTKPLAKALKTTTCVYVFKVNGIKVYDTEAQQKTERETPYSERGADHIPEKNILARIVVDRYHEDGAGEYDLDHVVVSTVEYLPTDDAGLKSKLCGSDELLRKFKTQVEGLRTANHLSSKKFSERLETRPQAKALRERFNPISRRQERFNEVTKKWEAV